MTTRWNFRRILAAAALAVLVAAAARSHGAAVEPVLSLAQKEKPALLETLKELVSIESGSADRVGLDRIAEVVAGRLKALGGAVETIEPRLYLAARMIMDIARGEAPLP